MPTTTNITAEDLQETRERIEAFVHHTPVMTCGSLDRLTGCDVFLKTENFQRGGAFKIRGAINFISRLSDDERANGVVTHSSGNHAQAVALAAGNFQTKAYIVMPNTAPKVKRQATEGYGGEIVFCEPNMQDRQRKAQEIQEKTGAVLVHPYDHDWIIMGQSSATAELIEDTGVLDTILCPVGGGGLISGACLAAMNTPAPPTIIGVEPELANDAYESFRQGSVVQKPAGQTIADGLKAQICDRTLKIIREHVDKIVPVSEHEIKEATYFLWERAKLVVEPSGATALAALLFHPDDIPGQRIGVLVTGGNVDLRGALD